jgi:hypothetical protein
MGASYILTICVFCVLFLSGETLKIDSDEVIIIPLSPKHFNWTATEEGTT